MLTEPYRGWLRWDATEELQRFARRSHLRSRFRRRWWRRLSIFVMIGLYLLDPSHQAEVVLPYLLALVWLAPDHRQREDGLEEQARQAWLVAARAQQGLDSLSIRSLAALAWDQGLLEMAGAASSGVRLESSVCAWARALEWELEGRYEARQGLACGLYFGLGLVWVWQVLKTLPLWHPYVFCGNLG